MTRIVLTEPLALVMPHHAFVFVAIPHIYSIFAPLELEERRAEAPVRCREIVKKMNELATTMPYREVIVLCDETLTTPEVLARGRVRMKVLVRAHKIVETFAGVFTMGRTYTNEATVEIEDQR